MVMHKLGSVESIRVEYHRLPENFFGLLNPVVFKITPTSILLITYPPPKSTPQRGNWQLDANKLESNGSYTLNWKVLIFFALISIKCCDSKHSASFVIVFNDDAFKKV